MPVFNICSPVFTDVTVKLSNNKTFRIIARKSDNQHKYIKNATLNGRQWDKPWFSWDDIKEGGELVLDMDSRPDYKWGTAPEDAPPSGIRNKPTN